MPMTSKKSALAERLWREGVSAKEIAERCDVAYYTIINHAACNRARFPMRHNRARLTKDQVDDIFRLRSEGYSYRQIAKKVGCSPNAARMRVVKEEAKNGRLSA